VTVKGQVDHRRPRAHVAVMQNRGTWIAFLTMCFALTGMIGLFASYSSSIPLERAMHRLEILEPDPARNTQAALREAMGRDAGAILAAPGDDQAHLAQARAAVRQEASDEERSVSTRTRWMIVIVTTLSAGLGAGMLVLASRPAR